MVHRGEFGGELLRREVGRGEAPGSVGLHILVPLGATTMAEDRRSGCQEGECWNRAPPSLRVGTPELPQTAPKARDRPSPQSRMTSRVNHSEAPSSLPMSTIDQRLPADGRLMPVLKKIHSKPRSRSPKVQAPLPSKWPLALSDPARGCRWLCGNRTMDIRSRTPQVLIRTRSLRQDQEMTR